MSTLPLLPGAGTIRTSQMRCTIMNLPGYYSTGQFAKLADVSVRTIRFYDRSGTLKPSYVNENGARFYTDSDLVRLQQILLLKYLGFSLEDIREMTISQIDSSHLLSSLKLQQKLVRDRIEQMQTVCDSIEETAAELSKHTDTEDFDWKKMLDLIHLTGMENSLASQYRNSSNLTARIDLHNRYSVNRQGWFPWLFSLLHLRDGMKVLELGCGDGALWTKNPNPGAEHLEISLSDISDGMVRDARRNITQALREYTDCFSYYTFDCSLIPFEKSSMDLVIANHVLFYCEDIRKVLQESRRVLRDGGRFVCSAYGSSHMQEITQLVQEFDPHIVLSADRLYERFGLDSGRQILEQSGLFDSIELNRYEDSLVVTDAQPLIEYILSCHGNQNRYLINRYREFRLFVEDRVRGGLHITKDAGAFTCR